MPNHKNLDSIQRQELFKFLIERIENGQPKHGCKKEAAKLFSVSESAISRFWKEMKKRNNENPIYLWDITSKKNLTVVLPFTIA
jgi:transposase